MGLFSQKLGWYLKSPYVLSVLATLLIALPFLTIHDANKQDQTAANAQLAQTSLYVSTTGVDTNPGTSLGAPLRTIQAALNKATPGTTINLAAGTYHEKLSTKVNGTASAPITIKGPEVGKDRAGRYKAVLYGAGRIVNVDHSYYVFDGFTIDGQEQLAGAIYPNVLDSVRTFKDSMAGRTVDSKLIYIGSLDTTRNVTGVVIRNMYLNGSGGECIRMRNNAQNNQVIDSVIKWCGMYAKGDDIGSYKYHNAEGVYIGTSPKSLDQPMYANDPSSFNIVRNNTIYTFGSECMDVKENAHDNTFANNDCRYNDEPYNFQGSLVELRGYNNYILNNIFLGSRGMGIKMKSDNISNIQGGNSGKNNSFSDIDYESIRNDQVKPQGIFCGNNFNGTIYVTSTITNPTAPCPTDSGPAAAPVIPPTATTAPFTVLPKITLTPTPKPIYSPTPTMKVAATPTLVPVKAVTPTAVQKDTQAPAVSIMYPSNGSSIKKDTKITINASASDNVKVSKVEFYVDNVLKCTDTTASYTCSWTLGNKPNVTYTILTKAYDTTGNSKVSSAVKIKSVANDKKEDEGDDDDDDEDNSGKGNSKDD